MAVSTPDDIDLKLETASAYYELAEFYRFVNRNDESSSILNRAAQMHEALATQFPSDPDILLGQANAFDSLGRVPVKKDLMASYLGKAVELHRKLCAEFPKVIDYQVQLSRSHVALAEHLADHPPNAKPQVEKSLVDGMNNTGFNSALSNLKDITKGQTSKSDRPPFGQIFIVHRNASRMSERLIHAFHQGDVLSKIEVENQFKSAERIAEQAARSNPRNADARQHEAWVVQRRAHWESRMPSSTVGITQYQRAIQLYRAVVADFQNRTEFQGQLCECLAVSATECESTKKDIFRQNREQLLEAVQIADQLLMSSPSNRVFQSLVARANMASAHLLLDTHPAEADVFLRKALVIRESLAKENPNSPSLQLDLADTMLALSQSLAARQSAEESVKLATNAKSIYESLKSKGLLNQRSITVSLRDCDVVLLQVALMSQGDHELAVKILERILSASVHERIDHVLAACTYASAIRLSSASAKISTEQKAELRKQYLAKVIDSTQKLTNWYLIGSYGLEHYFREFDAVKDDPDYRKAFPPLSKDLLFPKPPIDMERWIR